MMLAEGVQLNEQLLAHIVKQTGGVFYRARNAQEVRAIYQSIDTLEKRSMSVPLYTRYYDIFEPILIVIIMLLALELCLTTFVWRYL
jgi:Ca-activated chloride channel family protein